MSNITTKFRAYTIWNTDAELKWLQEMASQGYTLVKVWPFFYRFECTEPKSVHYCHGFARVKSGDSDNYLQMYADAGWEHVTTYAGWQHYFRSDIENTKAMDKETAYRVTARVLKHMALFFLLGALILGALSVIFTLETPANLLLITTYLFTTGLYVLGFLGISYGRKRQLANLEKIRSSDEMRSK